MYYDLRVPRFAKFRIHTLLAILITLSFCWQSFAQTEVTATIDGHSKTIVLTFNDKMATLRDKMLQWEAHLQNKGVDAHLFIGSGEFRRAVLNQEILAPGDVEIFVEIRNKKVSWQHVSLYYEFLLQYGIDVKKEVRELFGDYKVVDLFVRDHDHIRADYPYMGEVGPFWEMGEINLNRLLYSPKDNCVYSLKNPEDLENLAKGIISFTEKDRHLPLSAPAPIKGIGSVVKVTKEKASPTGKVATSTTYKAPVSLYKQTALRMALRLIRLKVDWELSPNKNDLKFGKGFEEALTGFENFFAMTDVEHIPLYRMDTVYIGLFLKIFRNRSNSELKKIRMILERDYPEMIAIWKLIGLDYYHLTKQRKLRSKFKPGPKGDKEYKDYIETIDKQGVWKQAHFRSLDSFMLDTSTFEVDNPFKAKKDSQHHQELATPLLTKTDLKDGITYKKFQMIPMWLLQKTNPKLAFLVNNFEKLSLTDQAYTVRAYQNEMKFFAATAYKKATTVEFREKHFEQFAWIDPSEIEKDDKRSLQEYLIDRSPPEGQFNQQPEFSLSNSTEYNQKAIDLIDSRIQEIKDLGKIPVLMVDLDDTLFLRTKRVYTAFKRFDEQHNTAYFENLDLNKMPPGGVEGKIISVLAASPHSPKDSFLFDELVKKINNFADGEISSNDLIAKDDVNKEFLAILKAREAQGVKLVFLTARPDNQKNGTIAALRKQNLPSDSDSVIFADSDKSTKENARRKRALDRYNQKRLEIVKHNETANPGEEKPLPPVKKSHTTVAKAEEIKGYHKANPNDVVVGLIDDKHNEVLKVAANVEGVLGILTIIRRHPVTGEVMHFFGLKPEERFRILQQKSSEIPAKKILPGKQCASLFAV